MVGFSLFFILLQVKFNINMRYKEIFFGVTPDNEAMRNVVCAVAAEAGCESFEETDAGVKGYVQTDFYDPLALDELVNNFPLPGVTVSYSVSDVEDRNWNEEWEAEGFSPIIIDDRCVVYDAKHLSPEELNYNHIPLKIGIDACQAFGTGNHETTRLVVSVLLDLSLTGLRLLDCGCGSGILGIVAAKKGATEVVGYDIDEWSVNNTCHNAELNGVSIHTLEGDASVLSHVNGVFDIVVANINRNILLADMAAFKDVLAADGLLILSGFYEEDAEILLEKAHELGMRECGRKTENNWCCLIISSAV